MEVDDCHSNCGSSSESQQLRARCLFLISLLMNDSLSCGCGKLLHPRVELRLNKRPIITFFYHRIHFILVEYAAAIDILSADFDVAVRTKAVPEISYRVLRCIILILDVLGLGGAEEN